MRVCLVSFAPHPFVVFLNSIMSDYKEFGHGDDVYSDEFDYILNPILKILSAGKNRKILDIGCGNGWLANQLISLGYDVYGTDASEEGIEIAKRKNAERFFLQDLTKDNLPEVLQAIPFNTIVCTEVIEHLYSPGGFVTFCKKVLQKTGGGELVISTPYHGYLKNIFLAISGKMDFHFTVLWEGGHIKFWSRKTLTSLLEDAGFTVTRFVGCGRFPFLWKSMIMVAQIGAANVNAL